MAEFLARRLVHSVIAMTSLIILVFVLARLTGDPAALYLPESASQEMVQQFRELHGFPAATAKAARAARSRPGATTSTRSRRWCGRTSSI